MHRLDKLYRSRKKTPDHIYRACQIFVSHYIVFVFIQNTTVSATMVRLFLFYNIFFLNTYYQYNTLMSSNWWKLTLSQICRKHNLVRCHVDVHENLVTCIIFILILSMCAIKQIEYKDIIIMYSRWLLLSNYVNQPLLHEM